MPLTVAGSILLPVAISAQESLDSSKKESFVPKTYISSTASLYRDNDTEVDKRYGSIFGLGARVTKDINENFRWEVGVEVFNDEASFTTYGYDGKSQMGLLSFTGTGHYVSPWENNQGAWYTRAGFILTQLTESGQVAGESDQQANQGIGLLLGGGMSFFKDKDGEFFLELNYKSVTNIGVGGSEFTLGYRRALGKK